MALVPNQKGDLVTSEVELQTVLDLTALRGTPTELIGGTSVVLNSSDTVLQLGGGAENDPQRYVAFVTNTGMPVRASYIEKSGVLWPADFHSWNMVTTYYNFERSYLYFQGIFGDNAATLQSMPMRVLYWTDARLTLDSPSLVDNAFFHPWVKSFLIVPFKDLQKVPLAMNLGVIAHETAHRVFNYTALRNEGDPLVLERWVDWHFNLLKSIDEGFADFHAYGVTCKEPSGCNSTFLEMSLADRREVAARDFADPKQCLDGPTRDLFLNTPRDTWVAPGSKMYPIGTLWAAALFQGAKKAGSAGAVESVQMALVAAYDDATPGKQGLAQLIGSGDVPNNFTMEAVADTILSHISEKNLRTKVCNELLTRLQLDCTSDGSVHCQEMPHCPDESVADATVCPTIP